MKRFGVIVAGLFIVVGLGLAGFVYIGFWLSPQNTLAKADAVVAISGGETESRAAEAVRLYQDKWAPVVVFSGAARDTSGPSNAEAMRESARQAGISDSAILLDESATNTEQNALGVAKIVHDHGYHTIILVTSPYHQRRASLTFQHAMGPGVRIINHSTTDQSWRRSAWWVNDYSYNLTLSELRKTLYTFFFEHKS